MKDNTIPSTIKSTELKDFVNSVEFKLIVQEKHEAYKSIWSSWAEEGKTSLINKTSWNWWAFLFSSFWFLYRKMYIEFAIFIGFFSLWSFSFFFIFATEIPTSIELLSILVISLLVGAIANTLYLRRCLALANVANRQFGMFTGVAGIDIALDDAQKSKMDFLKKTGGTNLKMPLGFFIIYEVVTSEFVVSKFVTSEFVILEFMMFVDIVCIVASILYVGWMFLAKKLIKFKN